MLEISNKLKEEEAVGPDPTPGTETGPVFKTGAMPITLYASKVPAAGFEPANPRRRMVLQTTGFSRSPTLA